MRFSNFGVRSVKLCAGQKMDRSHAGGAAAAAAAAAAATAAAATAATAAAAKRDYRNGAEYVDMARGSLWPIPKRCPRLGGKLSKFCYE